MPALLPPFDTDQWHQEPRTCGLVSWEKGNEVCGPRLEIRCPVGDSLAFPLLRHQKITCPVQTSFTSVSNSKSQQYSKMTISESLELTGSTCGKQPTGVLREHLVGTV